ncbi:hypothetical protein Hanom_Chr16g01521681 [Helianthus anomalus]
MEQIRDADGRWSCISDFFSEIAIRMTYLYFILFPNNINFLLIQVMLSLPCSNDCRHTLIAATSPLISAVVVKDVTTGDYILNGGETYDLAVIG